MKFRHLLMLLSVAVVLFSSCSNSAQKNVIPKDATMVVSFDLKEIATKGELSSSPYLAQLKAFAAMESPETGKIVNDLIEDPAISGIDFSEPAYLFVCKDGCIGFTWKMNSASDLKDFFIKAGVKDSEFSDHDGFNWLTEPEGNDEPIRFAFNDNVGIVLGFPPMDYQSAKEQGGKMTSKLLALANQSDGDSFFASDNYSKMNEVDGEVKMFVSGDIVNAYLSENEKSMIASQVPFNLSRAVSVAGLAFENGQIVLRMKSDNDDPVMKHYNELAANCLSKLTGGFLAHAPEDFFMWGAINVNWENVLSALRRNDDIKAALAQASMEEDINFDQLAKSVNGGDITFIMPEFDNYNPPMLLKARMNDDSAFQLLGSQLAELTDDDITFDGSTFHFGSYYDKQSLGMNGKNLYWCNENGEDYLSPAQQAPSALAAVQDDILNSYGYFFINLKPVIKNNVPAEAAAIYPKMLNLESVVLRVPSINEFEARFTVTDKDQNILKFLTH